MGKSTCIRFIIAALNLNPDRVAYVAPTGKAATVLRKKGNPNAKTLHKLMYKSRRLPNGEFESELRTRESLQSEYDLIVVDEVSMVPKGQFAELLKFRIPIIACGDPGQIAPISRDGDNGVLDNPDVFLDEVLRQAQESEIIRLSMWIREGKPLGSFPCLNEQVKILRKQEVVSGTMTWADQILCATNRKRNEINSLMRSWRGFGLEPQIGDKIVSLTNHWNKLSRVEHNPLTNGTIGIIKEMQLENYTYDRYTGIGTVPFMYTYMDVEGEEDYFTRVPIDYNTLLRGTPTMTPAQEYRAVSDIIHKHKGRMPPYNFAYGYALTVHKFQGSSAPNILVFEENFPHERQEHIRWLYTSVTRPEEKLVIVKK